MENARRGFLGSPPRLLQLQPRHLEMTLQGEHVLLQYFNLRSHQLHLHPPVGVARCQLLELASEIVDRQLRNTRLLDLFPHRREDVHCAIDCTGGWVLVRGVDLGKFSEEVEDGGRLLG